MCHQGLRQGASALEGSFEAMGGAGVVLHWGLGVYG
jgi:hypothetical protein